MTSTPLRADTSATTHAASRAWAKLRPDGPPPSRVRRLQEKTKGAVYWLEGVGPEGGAVVAKCSSSSRIKEERAVYESVLPRLPISTLRYFGSVDEAGLKCSWLFMDGVDGEPYMSHATAHRQLAATWLALLHTSAARMIRPSALRDRGTQYHHTQLRVAAETIVRYRDNPALGDDDARVLRSIVGQCHVVASRWHDIELLHNECPRTFVHGDFAPKNMRLRDGTDGLELLPFDWGSAGWGSPAVDLVNASRGMTPPWSYWANPDLITYRDAVRQMWPELDEARLEQLANIGKIFRCLVCIALTAQSFATPWVERAMRNMRIYQAEMSEALCNARWVVP